MNLGDKVKVIRYGLIHYEQVGVIAYLITRKDNSWKGIGVKFDDNQIGLYEEQELEVI